MLASGTQVRGFEPGRSRRIFQGKKILSMPSFRGEVKQSVPCRRFAVKDPFKWLGTRHLSAKLPAISCPQFPLSLLEVSRIVTDMGAPGSASGNFQSQASTTSPHMAAVHPGAPATGAQQKKKKRNVYCHKYKTLHQLQLFLVA
jgi:hypothetical protein